MPDEILTEGSREEPIREQVEEFLRRLSHAEGALASLTAELDAVLDPATAVPVLLSRAQAALVRSEARHRDLVEHCPSVVVELAPDGTTLLANAAAQRLLGMRARDLEGRNWWTDVVPDEWRDAADVLARDLRHGDITAREMPLAASDGSLRRVEWTSANRYAPDGALEAVVLFGLDVTERRAAEEATRRLDEERLARAAAEAASRAKSEFLATMSHELRTPLNAIVGYAQLLEMGLAGPLSDAQRRYVERINATTAHLTTVVSEVLDLTKAEAGQLDVTAAPARADDAVSAAISLVTPQAAQRGVAVAHRCSRASELTYVADDVRVRQILVNLISNAVKFTPRGGEVVVRCDVADRPAPESPLSGAGPWATFGVRDTGVGIPRDKLEHIFEPFVQLDAGHTRREGGTGLGLTISRRLARLMGGDLTVESAPGGGSTFTLWLPTVPAARQEAPRTADAGGAVRGGLAEIGGRVARQAEGVASAVAERLRWDPLTPRARDLTDTQLKDHLATLIADLGNSLVVLAEHQDEPSHAVRDGTEIQRLIAERHGAQRAGLGWTEAAHRREHEVLREVLDAGVRRIARGDDPDAEEARDLLRLFVEQVERVSLHGMRAATTDGAGCR